MVGRVVYRPLPTQCEKLAKVEIQIYSHTKINHQTLFLTIKFWSHFENLMNYFGTVWLYNLIKFFCILNNTIKQTKTNIDARSNSLPIGLSMDKHQRNVTNSSSVSNNNCLWDSIYSLTNAKIKKLNT